MVSIEKVYANMVKSHSLKRRRAHSAVVPHTIHIRQNYVSIPKKEKFVKTNQSTNKKQKFHTFDETDLFELYKRPRPGRPTVKDEHMVKDVVKKMAETIEKKNPDAVPFEIF